jgi:hypothetical protein
MGDDDHDPFDLGQLLFGYLVYREIREGRLDGDTILRAGCLLVLLVGAVLGGGLLLVGGLSTSHDGGGAYPYETAAPHPTGRPAIVVPATPRPTVRPASTAKPTPTPTAKPTPQPTPKPLPGIGNRVAAGEGWAVTVTRVQRWRPGWYDEPGWRLLTAYVKVRMPADDSRCAWGDSFWVEARNGRTYVGEVDWGLRDPSLHACADYHRPTTVSGWVTFEIRDADAKGLVLFACLPLFASCETPAAIRLP